MGHGFERTPNVLSARGDSNARFVDSRQVKPAKSTGKPFGLLYGWAVRASLL